MRTTASRCLAFLLLLASALPLAAQAEHEDPVVYADQKTIGEDSLRAAGHVEIYWQDYVIYADAVDFNLKSRELFAEGRVSMGTKDMVLSGEKLVFNLRTQTGELVDTFGMASPSVRYETDRLAQTDRETLTFERLDFTSCAQVAPRWSIRCRRGRIKKEEYIAMHDVLLRIKSIPVFYLPYLRYPLKKDGRATGLLIPGFGNSELRGFTVQNQFFWAIRPNVDMTFGLDYFSRLGIGVSDELRYLFRRASGSARLYYFAYRKDNGVYNETASDYYIEADHKQSLPFLNTRLLLNVNRQSRIGFLRLLDSSFDIARNANYQTAVSLTSAFANVTLRARASHEETYYIQQNTSRVREYMPSLAFNLNQQKLGRIPGYFSLEAGFDNALRSGVNYEEEAEYVNDVRSQRFGLTPSYQLPLLKLPWLSSSLKLASKNAFYAKSKDPASKRIVDEPLHLSYHTASFTLQGPVFSRVFAGQRSRLKHVIEPRLDIQYSTKAENRERMIPVDSFDRPSYSYVDLSLTSRLLSKRSGGQSSPSEVLTYTIKQQYYFDPAEANNDLKINGEYPRFSPLGQSLRLRPGGDFAFDATAAYNHYLHALTSLNLSLSYGREGAPLTGALSYNAYRNPYRVDTFLGNRRTLGARLRVDLPGVPLALESRVDYDFREKQLLIGMVHLTVDYQCLLFSTEFKLFTYKASSYFQWRAGISFGNLGMVGDFFGGN